MKHTMRAAIALSALLLWPTLGWSADAPRESAPPKQAKASEPQKTLTYRPRDRGSPKLGRSTAGSRGSGERFTLAVLTPEHPGLTLSDKPSLFWSISADSAHPIEVSVVDPREDEPVFFVRLPAPVAHGVYRMRLSEHEQAKLERGVQYHWSVSVIMDEARRARDVRSTGMIELIEADSALAARIAAAAADERATVYAQGGIWYDALAALCDQMERSPADASLRRDFAALLRQVNLPPVSDPIACHQKALSRNWK